MLFDPGACCNCGPPAPNAAVIAYSCLGVTPGREMAGAKVVVKRLGDVVGEAETAANGRADFSLPSLTVSYDVTVEPPASLGNRYKTSVFGWTPSLGGENPKRLALSAADGFVCFRPIGHPIAKTLYLTLDGTYVLTFDGFNMWRLVTVSQTAVSPVTDLSTCGMTAPAWVDLRIADQYVSVYWYEWGTFPCGSVTNYGSSQIGGINPRTIANLSVAFTLAGGVVTASGVMTQCVGQCGNIPCPTGTSFALSE